MSIVRIVRLLAFICLLCVLTPCRAQTVTLSPPATAGNPACWTGSGAVVTGSAANCANSLQAVGTPSTDYAACWAASGNLTNCAGATVRCTDTAADAALIQAALGTATAVGPYEVHIIGQCMITTDMTIYRQGQYIHGDGQTQTVLTVPGPPATISFTNGVFVANPSGQGPRIEDLGITVVQPEPATPITARGEKETVLINVTALYLRQSAYFQLHRVRLIMPMVGVDMQGNSGGAILDDVEMSPLSVGIWIDGSIATVKIDNLHISPDYGLNITNPHLSGIYNAPNIACNPQTTSGTAGPIGIWSGRMDDLHLHGATILVGQSACFENGIMMTGGTTGEITSTDFDSDGGVVLNAQLGRLAVSSTYFTYTNSSNLNTALTVNQGVLSCSACDFYDPTAGSNPMIMVNGTGFVPTVTITGSRFDQGGLDITNILAENGGSINVSNSHFTATPNMTYTQPIISVQAGALATLTGNRTQSSPGTGSGTFISIAHDDQHVVMGNSAPGWALNLPTVAAPSVAGQSGIYACNGNTTNAANGCNTTGTWTPALTINGSAAGITYTSATGTWKTSGTTVTLEFNIQLSSKGTSTGPVMLTGFPFPAGGSGGSVTVGVAFAVASMQNAITGRFGGSTGATLTQMTAGGSAPLTDANLTATTQLIGTATYFQ